jgi:hypothetical protein
MFGSSSSRCSVSSRPLFAVRSKMLLELEDFFEQVLAALENLFHD